MTDITNQTVQLPPWLAPLQTSLATGWAGSRFPHALLLVGVPGLGQSLLASWTAALALCDRPDQAPCGACAACELLRAGSHPDLHVAALEDDASQVKVDQIRGMAEVLGFKSYRGGYKVGIVDPADRMNVNAANALLKTLEEPPPRTLLVLVASRPERMPATIASRCQRITVRRPSQAEALAWLERTAGAGQWERLLELAAGAPLRAIELAGLGMGDIDREMREALDGDASGRFDPIAAAEAWSRDRPAERLTWLEYWLAGRIRVATVGDGVNNNRLPALPFPGSAVNIRASFDLLDRVREGRTLLQGSLNVQLLFEGLLVKVAALMGGPIAALRETAW